MTEGQGHAETLAYVRWLLPVIAIHYNSNVIGLTDNERTAYNRLADRLATWDSSLPNPPSLNDPKEVR